MKVHVDLERTLTRTITGQLDLRVRGRVPVRRTSTYEYVDLGTATKFSTS